MESPRFVFVLVSVLGCTATVEDDDERGTSGESGSPTTGTDDTWPPQACDLDVSPFLDAECLGALRLGCNAHGTEGACTGAEAAGFDGYTIRCGWAQVVTFSDATTCDVASTSFRCEAYIDQECFAVCSAITSQLEIVQLCGGPIGPGNAVDSDDDVVGTCAPNTQPAAPALCDCAPASCDVE
jgi:hypothetical protein